MMSDLERAMVVLTTAPVVKVQHDDALEDKYGDERDSVKISLANGREVTAYLYGDCCSRSFFADAKQFKELVGATILSAEEREGAGIRDQEGFHTDRDDHYEIKPHFLVFTTDKGHVTIDWRNESNGYYDGYVNWIVHRPKPLEGA